MREGVYKVMMRSNDEGIIKKCMRLFILIASSGQPINDVISQNEL